MSETVAHSTPIEPVHEKVVIRNSDGVITEEANMVGGLLHGETVVYSHGRAVARLQFRNGKQEGEAVFFNEIGQVTMKLSYRNGKQSGESTYFDQNGKVLRKEHYEGGELHGRKTDFYPSGKAREVYHYEKGLLHGDHLRFSLDGKIEERNCFVKGKPVPCPPQLMAKR
jgi:antitoxin component YwqK of YwqJK toxin-antitoxin module